MNELTPDLMTIRDGLSRAIRRDHHRRAHRRRVARTSAAIAAAALGLTGTALAAGELTGVIDLGDGQSAVPVKTSLGSGDPNLPYRYRVEGLPANRDGNGPIYVESTHPLRTNANGRVDMRAIVAARRACLTHTTRAVDALIWVFDAACDPATR